VIKYRLRCEAGHEFEGWFRSSAAFEAQSGAGRVTCPDCGGTDVSKAVMAPSVAMRTKDKENAAARLQPDKQAQFLQLVREARQKLVADADDVGDRFPEEARKIHYEEVEARKIYGEATGEEVHSLLEEGIEFMPLPRLPEDGN